MKVTSSMSLLATIRNNRRQLIIKLSPLIGQRAAALTVASAFSIGVGGFILTLLVLPLMVAAEAAGQPILGILAGVAATVGCWLGLRGIVLDRRSVKAAETYVGEKLGYPVRLTSGGRRPSRWQESIDIAKKGGRLRP